MAPLAQQIAMKRLNAPVMEGAKFKVLLKIAVAYWVGPVRIVPFARYAPPILIVVARIEDDA